MKKVLRAVLIIITTILPFVLSLFVFTDESDTFLWSLLIIPSYLIIISFPNWFAAMLVIVGYAIIQFTMQFLYLNVDDKDTDKLVVLILNPAVNISIILIIAYYRIKVKSTMQRLEEISIRDPLTGAYNRRYLVQTMESNNTNPSKILKPLQIIIFDIDHFKNINDMYGHLCGDEILIRLVEMLNTRIRRMDTLIRMGGEEFVILLPETTLQKAEEIAEELRILTNNTPFYYNNIQIPITISMGIAQYDEKSNGKFVDQADQALYQAKKNGRNQVAVAKHGDGSRVSISY